MENVKDIISTNLTLLRKSKNLTQKELAEKLNYSDKAVSRWELSESLPSIDTLVVLCDFYGVDFNWLTTKHDDDKIDYVQKKDDTKGYIKVLIAVLSVVCCFTIATIVFVYNQMMNNTIFWQAFVWALPVSFGAVTICSKKWWDRLFTTIFASCTMWTLILSIFLSLLAKTNAWPLFLLGFPVQVIIVLVAILYQGKNSKKS